MKKHDDMLSVAPAEPVAGPSAVSLPSVGDAAPVPNAPKHKPIYRAWHPKWSLEKDEDLGHGRNGMEGVRGAWLSNTGNLWLSLLRWKMDQEAKNWILMEYTGLKDRKGKMIYEGDILQETAPRGNRHRVFRVPGGFAINTHQDELANPRFYESIADMQTRGAVEAMEVIGNIHANPPTAEAMLICTQPLLNLWATQRSQGLSAKEIGKQEGCSHDAMRRRFSDHGVPSPFAIRREIIAGLYKRGTDREIVRYILLHRGWTISVEAVKMIRWRMDLKKRIRRSWSGPQMVLFVKEGDLRTLELVEV